MNALLIVHLVVGGVFVCAGGVAAGGCEATRFVSYEHLQSDLMLLDASPPGVWDFQLGIMEPGSVLERSFVVSSVYESHIVDIFTAGYITYVRARDQTNGTGGYVRFYRGGIEEAFVQLHFHIADDALNDIHFYIEVYTRPTDYEAAAEFRRGILTENSVLDYTHDFVYYGRDDASWVVAGVQVFADDADIFTFVETFDLSEDQVGGFVLMTDEVLGANTFSVFFRAVAPEMPLNMSLAVYTEARDFGGRPFRLGRYVPGLDLLDTVYLTSEPIIGAVVTGTVEILVPDSTIIFVQARDFVPNGHSELVEIASGGLGSDRMRLLINSGVNEPLSFSFEVYGIDNSD